MRATSAGLRRIEQAEVSGVRGMYLVFQQSVDGKSERILRRCFLGERKRGRAANGGTIMGLLSSPSGNSLTVRDIMSPTVPK